MQPRIRALIVDDEVLACRKIRRLLQKDVDIEIVGECRSGKLALVEIQELKPALVFLDVQMPEMNGFEVLEKIPIGRMPFVVFVTAFDQYAVHAFDVYAVDYLLKPFGRQRFEKTLLRAKAQIQQGLKLELQVLLQELKQGSNYLERVMIRTQGRIFFLKVSEIDWIQAEGRYVHLHHGKESTMLRESISTLESQLNPNKFLRISRGVLVNFDHVRELQQMFRGNYLVVLNDGARLKLNRRYRNRLRSLFSEKVP